VLRLVSASPALKSVVDALLRSLPAMGAVAALLLLVLYVGAVISTELFGGRHPDLFGNLGVSLLTLFQVLTLEGWPDVMRQVSGSYPWAWLFFVPFVLIATFAVLNLVVAVIVDSMQTGVKAAVAVQEEHRDEELREDLDEDIGTALRAIQADLAELKGAKGKSRRAVASTRRKP